MSRESPHDVSITTGVVLVVFFLALVGIGIATVVVPEVATEPQNAHADGGVSPSE